MHVSLSPSLGTLDRALVPDRGPIRGQHPGTKHDKTQLAGNNTGTIPGIVILAAKLNLPCLLALPDAEQMKQGGAESMFSRDDTDYSVHGMFNTHTPYSVDIAE